MFSQWHAVHSSEVIVGLCSGWNLICFPVFESGHSLVIFFIIYVIIPREKLWPLLLIYYYNGDTEPLESGSNTQLPCWLLTPHVHPSLDFHWCWSSFRAPALKAFLHFIPQRISSSLPSPQMDHHDVVWSSQLSFIWLFSCCPPHRRSKDCF